MLTNLLASAGPTTGVFESLASSIGAGLVVGGFVGGVRGIVTIQPRSQWEVRALKGSYFGGIAGLLLLAIDILEKAFV